IANNFVTIDYFKQINQAISNINQSRLKTVDDVRLYLNRIVRLKNYIIKAKYRVTYELYHQTIRNSIQTGGNISTAINNLGKLKNETRQLIIQQDELIKLFESFINELSENNFQYNNIGEKIGTDCEQL